ncbi:FAD-dependent oxidoreductase [Bacillus sp. T3]|uniref:FAD-dependent oxidoreductase n=1 Tax=Bacillus sp. T3 TaxID=467262 RepID=UPI002980B081|nr:FAD-dependent oxidoreductase [Bacillus sp. T3]
MNRRFVRNKLFTMITLIILILSLLLQGCSGITNDEKSSTAFKNKTLSTDVVVVGSGATGLSASVQAKQLGLNVILLEKNGTIGGTTNVAEGYGGINTNFAVKAGYQYNVKDIFNDAESFHHWANNPEILQKYYESSAETGNWLESLGVKFEGIMANGANKYNTWHFYEGLGKNVTHTLSDNAKKMGVKILLETRGKELIMKDGKVAGIKAQKSDGSNLTIKAPVVILATGGYAGNPDMVEKYAKVDPEQVVDAGVPGRTWRWYQYGFKSWSV